MPCPPPWRSLPASPRSRPGSTPASTRCWPASSTGGRPSTRRWPSPSTPLRRLVLAGGKRLRPAFCHWAFVGAGGDAGDPAVVDAGAALELLHTFALIHDDVMDGSATRRAPRHRPRRASRTATCCTAGGASAGASARASPSSSATSPSSTPTCCSPALRRPPSPVFNELRIEVNVGQYLDLAGDRTRRPEPADGPTHLAVQVGQVHRRAPAAPRRRAGRPARRAGDRPDRATACRSARRSSCATTCSACSATRRSRASPSATTSARASPPCCCAIGRRAGGPGRERPRPRALRRAGPRRRRGRRRCRQVLVDTGRPRRGRGAHRHASSLEATAALDDARLSAESRVALCELAGYAAGRDH